MNRTFLVFLLTLFYCCLILIIDELIAIKFRNIVMMRRRKVCTYEKKGILLTAETILSYSLGAFASGSTHEGMYNGNLGSSDN